MATTVLVFVERRDGEIKRATLEAVGAARALSPDVEVVALALGPDAAGHAELLGQAGVSRLLIHEDPRLELYAVQAYAACLADAATACSADLLLIPGTVMGRDLAARTAARLDVPLVSDAIELELSDAGALTALRPVYSGKATVRVSIADASPKLASLRPNVFPVAASDGGTAATTESLSTDLSVGLFKGRVTRTEKPEQEELDVSEASIVVAGGRGLKEPEHFSLIRDLADAVGGAVGASRAVVDAGWIAHSHQVGQTGKVVSPSLYIACGISGAIQHLAGMTSSKIIVAINKDPDAPIFEVANLGVVADLFEIVPALTAAVSAAKG